MTDSDTAVPRCWADGVSSLVVDHPIECQALGTEHLGLCPRHAAEIIGPPPPA